LSEFHTLDGSEVIRLGERSGGDREEFPQPDRPVEIILTIAQIRESVVANG
jgi:hypothetical protein